ncbi:GntR family transcriptional regulator [Neorhizobium sp. DT-125]|uniref:GntR family transcriptional regulator n=1 Tax=Neorhizobium sp. DT-125 TaxID=3396163 RepID=UPI003F1C5DB5
MGDFDGVKANKNINPMKKNPIQPQSLAAIVADRLKSSILSRQLALGEALSEEKIASAMEVSRTPVREALTLLQLQGLITILPRRGSFVFKPDRRTLHDLVEYRLHLELLVAGWATERAPEALHASLMEALAAMEKSRAEDDALAYATADTQFHDAFFIHCANPFFVEAYDIAAGRIAALRSHLSGQLGLHRQKTFQEHQDMAEAVKRQDVDLLHKLLRQHIEAMEPNYASALEILQP